MGRGAWGHRIAKTDTEVVYDFRNIDDDERVLGELVISTADPRTWHVRTGEPGYEANAVYVAAVRRFEATGVWPDNPSRQS